MMLLPYGSAQSAEIVTKVGSNNKVTPTKGEDFLIKIDYLKPYGSTEHAWLVAKAGPTPKTPRRIVKKVLRHNEHQDG